MAGGILLAAVTGVQGQATGLLLNVKKKEDTESKTRTTSGPYSNYSSKSGVKTLAYTVEISNASTGTVNGLSVHWAVLLRNAGSDQLKLVEGKKVTDLARGQKFSFDTDIIELGRFYQSRYHSSKEKVVEPLGYLVETVVDGNVVSSSAQPPDIRTKINQARANASQKRHRFD